MPVHNKAKRVERIQGGLNVRTDCFAYDEKKRDCTALNQLYCMNEKCSFFKPKESVKHE